MNPELKRNLWLEFSLHRLVAMPVVLGLIFLGVALGAAEDAGPRLVSTGLTLFLGLTGIWGTHRAAATVAEEFRARTWDGQRLSAIGPWTMTWGKLLGSTSFAWYGALMCLGVVAAAWPAAWTLPMGALLGLALCLALWVQALALLASLMATRKELTRSASRGPWLAVLLLSLVGLGHGFTRFPSVAHGMVWWGQAVETWSFVLWSVAALTAWTILGAYRLMCQELQVRRLPWAWVAFVLYLAWYLTGFVGHASLAEARAVFALIGLLIALAGTYMLLFTEQSSAMVMRRAWIRVQRREWRRALEEMPCWPISLLLAVAFCGLLLLTVHRLPIGPLRWHDLGFPMLPLLGLLLCVRDTAIFQFFAYARVPRRVEAVTLFYLLLLYLILPMVSRAIGANLLSGLILPLPWPRPTYAVMVLAVHAIIACGLVVYRWRQTFQEG